ncbi:hypothetical protein [Mogibacterium diversum]|uniref:hypothetical protein n=1 Tax=Mogibacterium diversum TaxID=114527 RepID=UPI0026EE6E84|nr:hypothetical protein [Mogibacterium diversum]
MDKKQLKSIGNTILGLSVVLIGGYFIFRIFIASISSIRNFITTLSNMDAVVIVALITGSLSFLSVFISSIVSKILEYKQNTKRYLYEKKEAPYSEFIDMVYRIQANIDNEEYNNEGLVDDVYSFSKKLTLWGSNEVIKKWLEFRELSLNQEDDSDNENNNLIKLEEIIFEIRKDMGQKQRGLKQGDILKFFITDVDYYIGENKKDK